MVTYQREKYLSGHNDMFVSQEPELLFTQWEHCVQFPICLKVG